MWLHATDMVATVPFNSRLVLGAALCLALAACSDGSPNEPTPATTCTYTLSVSTLSVPSSGGSTTVGVTTASQCTWSASSDSNWITVTAGATGTGTGSVNVAISPNPASVVRTGTLTIAGQAVSVTEAAENCTVTLSSPGSAFPAGGATGNVTVSTAPSCAWTAVSSAPWLTISTGTTGTGNGTVVFAISPNTDPSARGGTIVVNEKSASVSQEGALASCNFSVAPVSFTPCISEPADMTATVSTQAACTWTVGPTSSWVIITGGQSGTGSGLISFRVRDNFGDPRYSTFEVRGPAGNAVQSLEVAQIGCSYAVSPSSMLLPAAGGAGMFQVTQRTTPDQCGTGAQAQCQWTAVSNAPWITVSTPMPQVGDRQVSFALAPNTTGVLRTSTIVLGNQVVSISQEG